MWPPVPSPSCHGPGSSLLSEGARGVRRQGGSWKFVAAPLQSYTMGPCVALSPPSPRPAGLGANTEGLGWGRGEASCALTFPEEPVSKAFRTRSMTRRPPAPPSRPMWMPPLPGDCHALG